MIGKRSFCTQAQFFVDRRQPLGVVAEAGDLLLEAGGLLSETGYQRQEVVSPQGCQVFTKNHSRSPSLWCESCNPAGSLLINYVWTSEFPTD